MQILSMNATNETLLGADGNTSTVHCSLSSWQSVNDYQQLVWE